MNCKEAEALLVDDVAGAAAHQAGCAACRGRLALWQNLGPVMRGLAPPPPDAMRARRMMIEVERQLASDPAARVSTSTSTSMSTLGTAAGRRGAWRAGGAVLVAVAAALVLWFRHPASAPHPIAGEATAVAFATVLRADGPLVSDGHPLAPRAVLEPGSELSCAGPGITDLSLARGSWLRLVGPARVALGGTRSDVSIRLDSGTLTAAVAHRAPAETFAVITRDLRVEVRGTRFSVGATVEHSWVSVDEGRVEVVFRDGRTRLVSAGETADSIPEPGASPPLPSSSLSSPLSSPPGARGPSGCAETRRACEATARAVRESMRAGDREKALRLLSLEDHKRHDDGAAGGCPSGAGACADELGYLRAETLRGAGRIDDAIGAYKALDRRGAPPAMRQNALYAAAELERRQGHPRRARADYQSARTAAPRGALREEARVGEMDSALEAGDGAAAQILARRYLREFPAGLGAAQARRLIGKGGGGVDP